MKHIIAMGGGGLSLEPDKLLLDQYALTQSGKARPAICFLPSASADPINYTLNFYAAVAQLECRPSHLNLFSPPTADLESFLLEKDVIYVGGGNTKSMLALWREWQMDKILRKAWERGVVLAGVSAGAICWFEEGLTDSIPGPFTRLKCLGFLAGTCCPHYDGEVLRRPRFHELLQRGEIMPGYAVEDGAALHYVDDKLSSVVSSRPNARAYAVEVVGGAVRERPVEAMYLGNRAA
jgi:dipeptidase E